MDDEDDENAPTRDWRSTPGFNFGFAGFCVVFGFFTYSNSTAQWRWVQFALAGAAAVFWFIQGVRALRKRRTGLQDLP